MTAEDYDGSRCLCLKLYCMLPSEKQLELRSFQLLELSTFMGPPLLRMSTSKLCTTVVLLVRRPISWRLNRVNPSSGGHHTVNLNVRLLPVFPIARASSS